MIQSQNNRKTILQQWMIAKEIKDYLQLSRESQVSELQFYRLENGLIDRIPLGILKKIAFTLDISLSTLITDLTSDSSITQKDEKQEDLKAEYQRLLAENEELKQNLILEYQRDAIAILESLLLQLPTFIHAINQNPEIPAKQLLPLMQPLEDLLAIWEIETIGKVGDIVDYNPQLHELMEDATDDMSEIEKVKIRYVGYSQGNDLLYRAKVSAI